MLLRYRLNNETIRKELLYERVSALRVMIRVSKKREHLLVNVKTALVLKEEV